MSLLKDIVYIIFYMQAEQREALLSDEMKII
jgi:hypothetical protein